MIDYSMVKCKLMEPRIGTGYTFSKQSEFHGTRKYTINKPRLGEQGNLITDLLSMLQKDVLNNFSSSKEAVSQPPSP